LNTPCSAAFKSPRNRFRFFSCHQAELTRTIHSQGGAKLEVEKIE
jgi:hypothetical protein